MELKEKQQSAAEAPPRRKTLAEWRAALWCAVASRMVRTHIYTQRTLRRILRTHALYAAGELMYQIGFGAEYSAVQVWRGCKAFSRLAGRTLAWAARRAGRYIAAGAKGLWEDITGPFTGLVKGARGLRQMARTGYEEEGVARAARHSAAYLGRGAVKYFWVLGRVVSYLLPAAAAVVFVLTVTRQLESPFALEVSCNGQVVGYVEDELVFDAAREKVRSRIVLSEDQTWDVEPTFVLAQSSEVMDNNEMADAILMASADEIQEATGLEIDGQLVAIVSEGDQLREYLDGVRSQYEDPNNPNLTAEFVQDIQTVDGLYATASLTDYDSVIETLSGQREQEQRYAIQEGDSLTLVASRFNLTTADLVNLNPKLADPSYNWPIGDELVVHQSVPYLQVKTIETVEEDQVITHTSRTEDDSELAYGKTQTVQEGQDGLDHVTYEVVRINGIVTERNEVERVRIADPVEEVIRRGTKMPEGSLSTTAVFGDGQMIWPVPGYSYVSRWMSPGHKGADICASYGTPIVAADSGVVVRAGWNAAGSGYGYSVVIQHGPGNTTLYAHCSALYVSVGQSVQKGQQIAAVGSTGWSTGNHCHFEITVNGQRVSARNYFPNK